ncbi:MAG: hypothetical protein ACK5JT_18180, partial [Hyphomicrobiaceae bacterium]
NSVADKARMFSTALESHAQEIAQVLGRQASELDEQIMHGVHAVRRASENVTKQSVRAIEGLAGQADLLRNLSENLVDQIGSVTTRFDQQGQSIVRAASALETANHRIDQNLQKRQEDLSRTLEDLSTRADDIDKVMRGYPEVLKGSVSEFETSARKASEEAMRAAKERSEAARIEMERLKASTTSDAEEALSQLRSKFQNVSREVSDQLGSLHNRFNESYDDMQRRARSTFADIEGDHSRLTEEMARLPDATRASAEHVRHSLQEQLRALEQLSRLSSRESVRADVNRPGQSAQPIQSSPAKDAKPRQISSITQSLTSEMSQRDRAALPSGSAGEAGRSEGWKLGELLARASEDDGEMLSFQKFASALDQTTAAAIWSRLRAGQRGVMVRNIYSPTGRTIFDEVQRRYAADPTFRQTVDRFLADMLRILREAEQQDPSGRGTLNTISSEHGRCYLFLAHATGKIA